MSKDKDSRRVRVLHHCEKNALLATEDGSILVAEPMSEGTPLEPGTEIVDIEDCGEPGFANIRTICKVPGPAKVNSPQFKAGWDTIFSKPKQAIAEDVN